MSRFFQFGTSRLLQAHADLFVDEALGPDQICVVQTSGNPATLSRLEALHAESGFPVRIKGLRDGVAVQREQRVRSVEKALCATSQWNEVQAEFFRAEFILSNVSEKGYVPSQLDAGGAFDPAMSFPAKLLLLLESRFSEGGTPPVIFPLELFQGNGDKLRRLIFDQAREGARGAPFLEWLEACAWVNSLVDRIVSEPIEPAGAIAEPYALWAVEQGQGWHFPFSHEAVKLAPDLGRFEALKLYILNLSHSFIAAAWADRGMKPDLTVREYLEDPDLSDELVAFQLEEILPGFEAAGLGPESAAYRIEVLDRFRNPFLDHRISDIFDGHGQKVKSRAGGFLRWARAHGDDRNRPRLARLLEGRTSRAA